MVTSLSLLYSVSLDFKATIDLSGCSAASALLERPVDPGSNGHTHKTPLGLTAVHASKERLSALALPVDTSKEGLSALALPVDARQI